MSSSSGRVVGSSVTGRPGVTSSQGTRASSSRAGPVGKSFGAYLLLSELGRGSNGVVFLAQREGAETPCALKVLKEDLGSDEESLKRFRLEAAVTFKLAHPGIVRMLDAGVANGHHFYAMEYCPGETLGQRLVRGPFPPEEARLLILELSRTMAHAHKLGVLHRDIKPGNVILEPGTGRPRLTDFGLSRDRSLARSLTRSGDVLGTPAYMSPEQFRGQKDVDERVDVYALGAVLYECLTGQRPHTATTMTDLARQVLEEQVTPPRALVPAIPPALDVVCTKALSRDRDDRYRDAEELARALQLASGHSLSGERSTRLPGAAAASPARPRAPLFLAAGLLLAGLVGGGLIALRGGPARAARAQLDQARRLLDGSGDPATLAPAVEQAEAAARAAAAEPFLSEAAALRGDLELFLRSDELVGASKPTATELSEAAAALRARSHAPQDRWAGLAGTIDARAALLAAAEGHEQRRPVDEIAAALEPVRAQATADPRLRPLLEREDERLAARRKRAAVRDKLRSAWRRQDQVLAALQEAEQAAQGIRDQALIDEVRLDRSRYLLYRGRLDEAAREASQVALAGGRTGGEAALVQATALAWQGWWGEALTCLDSALRAQGPESVPAQKVMAMVRANPGQPESGQPYARRALEQDPSDMDAAVLLAQARGVDGDLAGALSDLDRVVQVEPDNTRAWVARMLLCDQAGDTKASDEAARRIEELAPGVPAWVYMMRGMTRIIPQGRSNFFAMQQRMAQGMEDMERFQKENPRDPRPTLIRGVMSMFMSRMGGGDGDPIKTAQALRDLYRQEPAAVERFVQNIPDQRIQFMLRQAVGMR